jgi:hypothetical protein
MSDPIDDLINQPASLMVDQQNSLFNRFDPDMTKDPNKQHSFSQYLRQMRSRPEIDSDAKAGYKEPTSAT